MSEFDDGHAGWKIIDRLPPPKLDTLVAVLVIGIVLFCLGLIIGG